MPKPLTQLQPGVPIRASRRFGVSGRVRKPGRLAQCW